MQILRNFKHFSHVLGAEAIEQREQARREKGCIGSRTSQCSRVKDLVDSRGRAVVV